MGWIEITMAIVLGLFVLMMLPRAKQMVENSPKGSLQDWMGFVVPVAAIVLFVIMLITLA